MAEQEVHLGSFAPPFRHGGLTLDSSLRQAIPNQVILGNQVSQKLGFSSLMLRIVSTGKGPKFFVTLAEDLDSIPNAHTVLITIQFRGPNAVFGPP